MRKLLADAYVATNQKALAYNNYLWIMRHHRLANTNDVETAKAFLGAYKN